MRVLDLWSYCSIGLLDVGCLEELEFADFFEPFLCPFWVGARISLAEMGV